MTQQHKQRDNGKQTKETEVVADARPQDTKAKEQLDNDIDAILGDIDDVLEINAEEFVKNYVQKGGQ